MSLRIPGFLGVCVHRGLGVAGRAGVMMDLGAGDLLLWGIAANLWCYQDPKDA